MVILPKNTSHIHRINRQVSPYMLNVVVNSSMTILRISIVARSLVSPSRHPTVDDDHSIEDESFCDHSMNMNVHPNGIGRF